MNPDSLQKVALACAEARAVDDVLAAVVDGLEAQSGCALARIWLIGPGDICATCRMRQECPDQTRCLHLAASAGGSLDGSESWDRLDGDFRRFPLGVRKIGRVAVSGEPFLIPDIAADADWIARPDWVRDQRIRSVAAQPLKFRGEVLGVLALFRREPLDDRAHRWLRTFADHAAVAIANARAFEEISALRKALEAERDYLREEVREASGFQTIIGDSPLLKKALEQIELVAATDASVLILGESGTGKELVARALHEKSPRRARTLVRVNCASVPKELFESEFFGHAKGSFTGAVKDRTGRFQLADRGTLFLDEVGEIPLDLQSKLLRVLQEGQFERVGEDRTRQVDVRLVAASNRDLKQEADAGRFREDLYYRLSVFPIELPSLRERKQDLGPLATHFLRAAAARLKRSRPRLARAQLDLLKSYDWPGNVRELQNVIERAVILSHGDRLQLEQALSLSAGASEPVPVAAAPAAAVPVPEPDEAAAVPFVTQEEIDRRERDNLAAALEYAGGKVYGPGGAAELLGMKASTLASRLQAMGIKRPAGGR